MASEPEVFELLRRFVAQYRARVGRAETNRRAMIVCDALDKIAQDLDLALPGPDDEPYVDALARLADVLMELPSTDVWGEHVNEKRLARCRRGVVSAARDRSRDSRRAVSRVIGSLGSGTSCSRRSTTSGTSGRSQVSGQRGSRAADEGTEQSPRAGSGRDLLVVRAEEVAYWFLRLNGFLTIPNFILHPDRRGSQRTDADIVGVRFPSREELTWTERPIVDHDLFEKSRYVEIAIAEIKSARDYCQLNGPWTDPSRGNIEYLLRAMGVFTRSNARTVARSLYDAYEYADGSFSVRFFAFGAKRNDDLRPSVVQLTWHGDVLPFIFTRFTRHELQKAHNEQWDQAGRDLYLTANACRDIGDFVERVIPHLT